MLKAVVFLTLILVPISNGDSRYWTSRENVVRAGRHLYEDVKDFAQALYFGSSSSVVRETDYFKDEIWDFYHHVESGMSFHSAEYQFHRLEDNFRDLWYLVRSCGKTKSNSFAQNQWRSVQRSYDELDYHMHGYHPHP